MRRAVLAAVVMAFVRAHPASTQWREDVASAWREDVASPWRGTAVVDFPQEMARRTDLGNSVIIAAIGSAAGILVGGLVGASIDSARDVPSEDPGLAGLLYGATAGSALLSPTLLFLANDRQGPFARALLLSVGATSLVALALWPHDVALLAAPIVQIGVSVAVLQ